MSDSNFTKGEFDPQYNLYNLRKKLLMEVLNPETLYNEIDMEKVDKIISEIEKIEHIDVNTPEMLKIHNRALELIKVKCNEDIQGRYSHREMKITHRKVIPSILIVFFIVILLLIVLKLIHRKG